MKTRASNKRMTFAFGQYEYIFTALLERIFSDVAINHAYSRRTWYHEFMLHSKSEYSVVCCRMVLVSDTHVVDKMECGIIGLVYLIKIK